MISPKTDHFFGTTSLHEATEAFFKEGGLLEQSARVAGFEYEMRPQQRTMALALADALEGGRHLIVEAGTGVGKSFAYLVPLILYALQQKKQVVVSTHTISLQEQLMLKDIPFLQKHMGLDFKAVLVKGRSNYLCLRRLARAEKMGEALFQSKEEQELEYIRTWASKTKEGSLQDLEEQPSPAVWSTVSVEHGNCLWNKCPEFGPCFFMKARNQMRDANLLIVNHHLFFSDMALRAQKAALLPDFSAAVMDEAHQVENVASEHLGVRLSQYAFEHWMRRLYVAESNKGLFALLKKGQAAHAVTRLREEVERFFEAVHRWAGFTHEKMREVIDAPMDITTTIPALIGQITLELQHAAEDTDNIDTQAELNSARRRGVEMCAALEAFLKQTLGDQVYWVEREGTRRAQIVLYSAPIEVAAILKQGLFESLKTVVMTSATLAINDKLTYFQERIGAESADALSVGSPFNYETQMRVIIPKTMPDPSDTDAYTEASAEAIKRYVDKTQGRAFVLFTSDRFMRNVAQKVRDHFDNRGYTLYMQNDGLSRHQMLERFREGQGNVLFGLDSFWMGVDVRGEALSNVIITRLPFAVPDEPLAKARMDRIKEKGGDSFKDYSLPEAILKFRQGVGRLIRSSTDRGIIVILDPRIRTKWYGKHFLASIPECPVEMEGNDQE